MTDEEGSPDRTGARDDETRHIGVYRLCRPLGRGGMGEVFLAHDDRLDRPVAIKRIRRPGEASEVDRERFRREARAAAKLNHPAITQVYDVVRDEAGDSIVMEYVEGRTLAELLAAGGLDGERASGVALQVAEGLAEAHAKGFVHRDLKAENVMVTPEGRAKILDFGLAKYLASEEGGREEDRVTLTATGAVLGTFSTMSPEQASGEAVDARSDLFSFGVLLYELFTGRSPFRRRNRMLSLRSVLSDRSPPPRALRPELPETLSDLIEKLLAKDPGKRPASAADVAERLRECSSALAGMGRPEPADADLRTAVESDAATLSEAGLVPRWSTAGPRHPRRRQVAVAVGVLVALVAAAVWLFRREETLYVLVAEPEPRGDAIPELLATGVTDATVAFLYSLRGVVPVDIPGTVTSDEILKPVIDCRLTPRCQISFQRYTAEGRIGGVEPFEVIEPEDYLSLASSVKSHLVRAYPERRSRSENPELRVEPEDYKRYLEFRRRARAGEDLDDASFQELLELLRRSPHFLDGFLLAAGTARIRGEPEHALEFLGQARELAPWDPRPLSRQLDIELESGRIDEATRTLEELDRVASGGELALRYHTRLLAAQGELDEAVAAARRLVEVRPSWINLWNLADYELRRGEPSAARAALGQLLETSPGNTQGLEKLAEIELIYGDARRAEELYRQLIDAEPQRIYYSNLGAALYRLGDYEAAQRSCRQALELAPGHVSTRFNLMLAHEALGQDDEARSLCRRLRDELDGGLIEALCLVRLDAPLEAVEIATAVLQDRPDDFLSAYLAAQVFALAGERNSALLRMEQALSRGYAPGWFQIPAFRSLAGDPAFEEKLRRYASARRER